MRPTRLAGIAVLTTVGFLLTSAAAMAAPNAFMNRDSNVRKTSSPSSAVVNFVEEDQEVQVLQCGTSRCKIKIPGPDGWVNKSYLELFEDEEEEEAEEPTPAPALPYGPDTCKDGFVWRDAIPGDHVCVTPDRRSTAASENAIAGSRVDPGGAYGPNSCVAGFVWREAYPGDVVCVTPGRRSQAKQENIDGPSHRVLP
ncbi:MAG: SH3 domain-containing protein [Devosia sp.]|nr:SH3 domain-containing protein [Devosia sp.]